MHAQLLEQLEKAVHAGNITAIVPEDLEIEAHQTLWNESDPEELTVLKLLANVPATSVLHEFTRYTSDGFDRNSGFFAERSLPPETNFGSERATVNIKLMGEIGPTFLLAALEKTQRVMGETGAQNIERQALRRNVLRKKNRNVYFADDSKTRLGSGGLRFKGIRQQIREGTDGTTGTSVFGSHEVDMEGQPLTAETIRDKVTQGIINFGRFSCLIMDPFARASMEASLDSANRLDMPLNVRPYIIGQNVGGLQTQGGVTFFHTDNGLSAVHGEGKYQTELVEGAPIGTPSGTAVAQADDATTDTVESKWDAASAGNVFYWVTETRDERESLGTRVPAAGFLAVAAAQEVELSLTPNDPLADSFKVYRGTDASTDAYFMDEFANTGGGGAVLAWDNNTERPNTTKAFGLNLYSAATRVLNSGLVDSYSTAVEKSASFLTAKDNQARNTIAMASLGPSMGIMALASVLAEVDRPLIYSACAPEVRNAKQNFVFKNIGTA